MRSSRDRDLVRRRSRAFRSGRRGYTMVEVMMALAVLAKVKRLFLFHHDPGHDDAEVSRMVAWARQIVAEKKSPLRVEAAREGLEVFLKPERKKG